MDIVELEDVIALVKERVSFVRNSGRKQISF